MGTRRIRCLQSIGNFDLGGFDIRKDRLEQSFDDYAIKTFSSFDDAIEKFNPNVMIISTPPDLHMQYANIAVKNNIDCFIEASVVDRDEIKKLSEIISNKDIMILPSCTMKYFEFPKEIKNLLSKGVFGKPIFGNYSCGQSLLDWHPWENISDFYVSNRPTGGCREIVPFELTWIADLFGAPEVIEAFIGKLSDIDVDIDDFYRMTLKFRNNFHMNFLVEVISAPVPTRELRIVFDNGIVKYSGESNSVSYILKGDTVWTILALNDGRHHGSSISPEEPYIAELSDFLNAVENRNGKLFPNSLTQDFEVLEMLNSIESKAVR